MLSLASRPRFPTNRVLFLWWLLVVAVVEVLGVVLLEMDPPRFQKPLPSFLLYVIIYFATPMSHK